MDEVLVYFHFEALLCCARPVLSGRLKATRVLDGILDSSCTKISDAFTQGARRWGSMVISDAFTQRLLGFDGSVKEWWYYNEDSTKVLRTLGGVFG